MLRVLLKERFFNSCLVHEEEKKNEENCFCMDCCLSLCSNCVCHHQSHKILQIRRYMYNDVLRLKDAQRIFDCSLIQSYTTNGERVVLLRPRRRISIPIRDSRCTCLVCGQSIKSSFVYCSMRCKFNHVTASNNGPRVYGAASSQDADGSLLVPGSAGESLGSLESVVEESSATATAGDQETIDESMPFAEEGNHPEQNNSTNSSIRINRRFRGRKCVPHRSPFF